MAVGTTYQQLLEGVANYYGQGSDQWYKIATQGVGSPETIQIVSQVPGVTITKSISGKFLGYDYNNPFTSTPNPADVIDSNIQSGSYGAGSFNAQLPATGYRSADTGQIMLRSGATASTGGATIAAIADKVSLAVMGVSLGTKLGKFIDQTIYNTNPAWWDEHFPAINPETWDDMATSEGGKNLIRALFGLSGDNTTMYLDERLLAQTYMTLLANGAYGDTSSSASIDDTSVLYGGEPYSIPTYFVTSGLIDVDISDTETPRKCVVTQSGSTVYAARVHTPGGANTLVLFSESSFRCDYWNNSATSSNIGPDGSVTHDGLTCYYTTLRLENDPITLPYAPPIGPTTGSSLGSSVYWNMLYIIKNGTVTPGGGLDGVSNNPNATTYIDPSLINGQDLPTVLQQLHQYYPELFQDSIYQDIPQPDGTNQRITYIPAPYPDTGNRDRPTTDDTDINPQTTPQISPQTKTEEQTQQITDDLTEPTEPPDTGDGSAPVPPVPTGSASSLWAVYNPSQGELNNFGAWLWSSNFVDQIKKLFADPMQAIIGVHKVFASPHTGGSQTIKCGYLDSGVSASVVTNQYTTVDCGSASLREYFGNVFDYDPFTKVSIFLPFIGIVPLNTADVMRSTISVKYKVDVITGACLAEVNVSRDGGGGILYTYGGSAIVTYPVSSGSYIGAIQAALSTALGIGSAIATGGASLGASAGMVLGGLANAKTQVQHSGQFSGSSGAMGGKKPYLIVSRPQTRTPSNINLFKGIPSNAIHKLSSCSGFVKVQEVHIASKSAYDNEIQEIESLLKAGVII